MAKHSQRSSSSSWTTSLQERMGRIGLNNSPIKEDQPQLLSTTLTAPLISKYNEEIRPLLDAVDKLRNLKVMDEGIQLPTIVVVGDQSSGKSSVLESLAGISLPRGQGICTRVPLIMRLQNHSAPDQQLQLHYPGKVINTDEVHISEAISIATEEIAGSGKCISNIPLTLVLKKKGVPDLTMVDLPGITRVPVNGQPEDIYEQISSIIMEYISPKESIILNVLSATVDFPTCESTRMSQRVDKTGERTLVVVTKVDEAPEGLLEKVTTDAVNIGLGYVCIRSRIGDETYEEARVEEALLFQSHPLLSKIDKSIVGIPALAKKLVQIQAQRISKCLPDIVKKITDKLNQHRSDLNKMPRNFSTVGDSMTAFMRVLESAKASLMKVLVRGEFDEYPDEEKMHCTARFAEMLDKYSVELQLNPPENSYNGNFLMDEIKVLQETKGICLPDLFLLSAYHTILQKKVIEDAGTPVEFMEKVWNYVEEVVARILMDQYESYPRLQSSIRCAVHNLMTKVRNKSIDRVKEIVDMVKIADYSSNPEYLVTWNQLMLQQVGFMEILNDASKPSKANLEMLGEVEIGHLRGNLLVEQAFVIKMRLMAYWKIVFRRLVVCLALHLHLLLTVRNLVNNKMEGEVVNELMCSDEGIERMVILESPSVASKREKLKKSIKVLKDSKDVVANIMDRVSDLSLIRIWGFFFNLVLLSEVLVVSYVV